MLLVILGCMGCCCGGLPLFGLWPRLDPGPVQAQLRGQPVIVDHACSPDVVCNEVVDLDVGLYALSYSLFNGRITTLVEDRATCSESERRGSRARTVACAGVVGALYASGDDGWELLYVTESTAGTPSSGEPYTGVSGGDWDD